MDSGRETLMRIGGMLKEGGRVQGGIESNDEIEFVFDN